jgi:hypothetical protein
MLSYFLRKEIALFAASRARLARKVPRVVAFRENPSLLPFQITTDQSRVGRVVGRDAVSSGQLGKGESWRVA